MACLHLLVVLAVLGVSRALNNGLALTPPMGFLDWERFQCNTDCVNDPDNCVSEKLFMKMADIIAEEGYRELGYEYIGIDDCWPAKSRDADGNLVADPERFPNGILGLSRYVHSRGLKLGIYEDVGTKTCAGYPGSQDYTKQDAETFARWELDLLKFDGCNTDANRSAIRKIKFPLMSQSLNATGRPILFTCEWWSGDQTQHSHYTRNSEYCNSWRTFTDILDTWPSVLSIIQHYAQNAGDFISVSGPGSINDPDELIIGDFSLSYDQEKSQFGMWAMFAAPLYISADLRTIRPEAKAILQNKGVIAINQDPLVKGANMIKEIQNVQGLAGSLWSNLKLCRHNLRRSAALMDIMYEGRQFSRTKSTKVVALMDIIYEGRLLSWTYSTKVGNSHGHNLRRSAALMDISYEGRQLSWT
ncbi:alpha-N-acetylgalactosaminidase-like [Haliotis rubra]|uniref:alpha-N-acetylgalactosaminidase-like n=1 Tax=Haliotis rubra TaxID=36100 RepID=UPI001EE57EBF|nr:alpha-N-acetylgalactosaminidase-like [Haliotis rubra]